MNTFSPFTIGTSLIACVLCGCGASKKQVNQDLDLIRSALEQYHADYGAYPPTTYGLHILTIPLHSRGGNTYGPYVNIPIPTDPWGNTYVYRNPGENGTAYDLLSCGPDGKAGTSDDLR